jgi:SOS response regulatory protein OraA/RecX
MSVSKKDFIRIAEILAKDQNKEEITNSVIAYFKSENPLFDEKRFRAYIAKRSA